MQTLKLFPVGSIAFFFFFDNLQTLYMKAFALCFVSIKPQGSEKRVLFNYIKCLYKLLSLVF